MTQIKEEKELDIKRLQKLPIIDPVNPSKKFSEKEEKWLREVENYEFSNIEEPGLMQTFSYGAAGNSMKITLFHGGKYKMPRFLARHIESRSIPIWKWVPDGMGSLRKEMTGRKSRFQMRQCFE